MGYLEKKLQAIIMAQGWKFKTGNLYDLTSNTSWAEGTPLVQYSVGAGSTLNSTAVSPYLTFDNDINTKSTSVIVDRIRAQITWTKPRKMVKITSSVYRSNIIKLYGIKKDNSTVLLGEKSRSSSETKYNDTFTISDETEYYGIAIDCYESGYPGRNQYIYELQVTEWYEKGSSSTYIPYVFPIKVNAGRFNFSWNNTNGRKWTFPAGTVLYSDGTTPISESTAEKPDVIIANDDSVVYLECDRWYGNYSLNDNDTDTSFIGNISDLPPLTNYLNLNNCSLITGSLSDLPPLTYYLSLYNCSLITGSLSDLPPLTYYLDLHNCSLITGSLADLPPVTNTLSLLGCSLVTGSLADLPPVNNTLRLYNCPLITGALSDLPPLTYYLDLYNCSLITGSLADLPPLTNYLNLNNCSLITGAYTQVNGNNVPTQTYLYYTDMTATDMDNTLIAYANCTKDNGTFRANGMTRTSASDTAVSTLTGRGWSITGITKV